MSYARLIGEISGSADSADIALTEELMRVDRTALDGLTRAEFASAVRDAVTAGAVLHVTGELAEFCAAFGLALPAWAH